MPVPLEWRRRFQNGPEVVYECPQIALQLEMVQSDLALFASSNEFPKPDISSRAGTPATSKHDGLFMIDTAGVGCAGELGFCLVIPSPPQADEESLLFPSIVGTVGIPHCVRNDNDESFHPSTAANARRDPQAYACMVAGPMRALSSRKFSGR